MTVSAALFLFVPLKFSQMELIQALISIRHLNSWDSVVSGSEAKDLQSSCQQGPQALMISVSSFVFTQFHLEKTSICNLCQDRKEVEKELHLISDDF